MNIEINNNSYHVVVNRLNNNTSDSSEIVEKYREDFENILKWSMSISTDLNGCSLILNYLTLTEIRSYVFLISADFSLNYIDRNKQVNAKDVKDVVQMNGIRYSKGYRYWFLFEMSFNFLQLYMFPYYRY